MNSIKIRTFEEIHHVCLMYGLKKAFCRFPFLARNIMATPPPVRINPERHQKFSGFMVNPVKVQYFKKDLTVLYDTNRVRIEEATAFAKAVIEEYLVLRHPYMNTSWNKQQLLETSSAHLVAEVIPVSPEIVDRP